MSERNSLKMCKISTPNNTIFIESSLMKFSKEKRQRRKFKCKSTKTKIKNINYFDSRNSDTTIEYNNEPNIINLLVNIGEFNESNLKLSNTDLRIYSNKEILKKSSQWASQIIRSKDNEFFGSSQTQSFALQSATAEIAKIEVETISILAELESKEELGDRIMHRDNMEYYEIIYDEELDKELSTLEESEKKLSEKLSQIEIFHNKQIQIFNCDQIIETGNNERFALAQ